MNEFLALHPQLDCEPSRLGTTVFPRLKLGHAAEFVEMVRKQFETSVVPGEFFDHPQHFRIGFGGSTETVHDGLERMSAALEAFQQRPG
jgi:aspartate/methionine/tyrosine aminotransferase